jgi:hypothetical protein
MISRTVALVVSAGLLVAAVGCGRPKEYEPYSTSSRTLFMPSVRTVGPEPVYARTRWVRAPQVLPQRDMPGKLAPEVESAPSLRTTFQLVVKDATLEETGRILGAMARYSSYTAPTIAAEKISIKNIGTIDELARIIESQARVQVVVDHENKEVRLLAAEGQQPRLYEE